MMSIRKLTMALAATALTVSPVAAQAGQVERAAAPAGEASELGGPDLWIFAVLAAVVVIWAVVEHSDDPASP